MGNRKTVASGVTSSPPRKFSHNDWTVKIGPHGIPHHPISRVRNDQRRPFTARLSPARTEIEVRALLDCHDTDGKAKLVLHEPDAALEFMHKLLWTHSFNTDDLCHMSLKRG
jgi:hypothetical protein